MARNVTITTTVTKTIGQIAYEASGEAERVGPWECITSEYRDKWEAIAEAVAKALDAERAAAVPHVRLTPLTHDPQQPLPVWPGEIVQAPGPKEWPPRPGYSPHGDPLMSAVISSSGTAEFHADGSVTLTTGDDTSGQSVRLKNPDPTQRPPLPDLSPIMSRLNEARAAFDACWNNPGGKR